MASVFSKIIAGEIPCYKIYEDEKTFVFLDINPEVRGHVLVVPKVEVDKIYELADEEYVAVFETVRKVCRRIEEVYGARAIFKVIGVDVPHAHVHVMPWDEKYVEGKTLELSEQEFNEICAKLAF